MNDIEGKWGYSTDREKYYGSFDTREEAIEEARACEPDSGFFTGQFEAVAAPTICAATIIESLGERLYDVIGEPAEAWLCDVSSEDRKNLEKRLNDALWDWLNDTGNQPRFGTVDMATEMEHSALPSEALSSASPSREGA